MKEFKPMAINNITNVATMSNVSRAFIQATLVSSTPSSFSADQQCVVPSNELLSLTVMVALQIITIVVILTTVIKLHSIQKRHLNHISRIIDPQQYASKRGISMIF